MKLLVVSDLYPPVAFGGYELDCASLVEGLRPAHDVTVLTSRLRHRSAPADPVVTRALPWVGFNHSVRDTARAPVAAASAARLMRRTLEKLRPDLVLAYNCLGIPQAVPMVAIDSGVPVAFRLSETSFATNLLWGDRFLRHLRPGGRLLLAPWGFLARGVNRVEPALRLRPGSASRVAISWASNDLRARTTLPVGMEVVLERVVHPASRQAEGLAQLERRPYERPTVLYLGRVTVGKGIEVAYRAVAALRERHGVDARLVVVGHADAASQRRLNALATELGIGEHVDLWGRVETDRFTEALQRSHVIVVPSLVQDVFPLVVVEAALARVPIVASRIGGIPEAVADGEEALLFEPGDADACASALAQTITEPVVAEERAARAFTRASALSMDRYVKESEAFVTDALAALRANGR